MPIYQYRCLKCEEEFEIIMSLSERSEKKTQVVCPACGSEESDSLVARTNFTLKGKGWYKDGYEK